MLRSFAFLMLFLIPFALTGCGEGNSNAPLDTEPHPESWISTHSAAAIADAGYTGCISCHGSDLTGYGEVPSCYSCHVFNTSPPLTIHPAAWTNIYVNHRGSADITICENCHGVLLQGSESAPSCYSSIFDGLSCHAAGPGQAPHPVDTSYLSGTVHGPVAKSDLRVCQACHGQAGGPGDNPRFNVGISSAGGNGCESCHGTNYAHPASWMSGHRSAGNISNVCTLCHGVALDGSGGVGISCGTCHGIPG
ncbi:MAG: hypothetical protein KKB30_09615 [Proteobacteria bacterium]|nr:hypothetical protein [Pseudomonadota bacterium]MBU1716977.1 hypothetical protein [Pseudomonadota bacterium]